jgi:hypothetical protein
MCLRRVCIGNELAQMIHDDGSLRSFNLGAMHCAEDFLSGLQKNVTSSMCYVLSAI